MHKAGKSRSPVVYSPDCSPEDWWLWHHPGSIPARPLPRGDTKQEPPSTCCYSQNDMIQLWAPDLELNWLKEVVQKETKMVAQWQDLGRMDEGEWCLQAMGGGACFNWQTNSLCAVRAGGHNRFGSLNTLGSVVRAKTWWHNTHRNGEEPKANGGAKNICCQCRNS